MTREDLQTEIEKAELSAEEAVVAGEILAETPDEELDVLAEIVKSADGLRRLIANYQDEKTGGSDVMEGAPNLVGNVAEGEGSEEV